ncbi:hypothetical protein ACWGQ5_11990 [Streptomyces sp. NPDC055722]
MTHPGDRLSRGLLALLTAAAFVIFAQAFMIAPILPAWPTRSPPRPERSGLPSPPA